MGVSILHLLLYLICGVCGYLAGHVLSPAPWSGIGGILAGFLMASLTLLTEKGLKKAPLKNLMGGFIGLIFGILTVSLVSHAFFSNLASYQEMAIPILGGIYGIFGYIGLKIGFSKAHEVQFTGCSPSSKTSPRSEQAKILDTSVIIDGRISDITETGFVEGPILIPRFVLNELQHIADSSDPVKRTRGKRGLEVLQHIQKQANIDVRIVDQDYPSVREVDAKLVELAKEVRGKIITNDSNLNKVAELQGLEFLNINALANLLKPVVLPGEEMNVKILKEGKEMGQGVAYLDDGTMIVVDNGRKQIGKTLDVVVTSILQTSAGRMIFARLKEETGRESRGKDSYMPVESEF